MPPRSIATDWYASFRTSMRAPGLAHQLQAAADGALLKPWTELLTTVVVDACEASGWVCAAKSAGARPLPVRPAEYLGIDVLAFARTRVWERPAAAFELENSQKDTLVAYALWKACMIRCALAAMFCYRTEPDAPQLRRLLEREVLETAEPQSEVLVVVGTRSAAGTFPDGYFRPYLWDPAGLVLRPMASR